jgi:hypothetical protein
MDDIPALIFTAFGQQTGLNAANKAQVQRHWHSGVLVESYSWNTNNFVRSTSTSLLSNCSFII